jgi:FtsJ-like methyltransferase/mRNA capping enzyme
MDAVLILSPDEFDIVRRQLNEANEKTEIEFRLFVSEDVYRDILNKTNHPPRQISVVKIKNTQVQRALPEGPGGMFPQGGWDVRVITENGKFIVQRKRRLRNINFVVNKINLRLSFSVEELLSEEESKTVLKEPNSYFDLIRKRERTIFDYPPFSYSFTKVNSITEGGDTYEVEAEFKGGDIFSLLRLNKIFTQIFDRDTVEIPLASPRFPSGNVFFTSSLMYLFNRPTNLYRKDIPYLRKDFFVTDKLDGERSFLCGTPIGTYLTIDPTFFNPDLKFESLTILDGEYLKEAREFHAFDCLCYNGTNTMYRDGIDSRLNLVDVEEKNFIVKKIHHSLIPSAGDPNEAVISWMRETMRISGEKKSNVDGLIFTSKRGDYSRTKTLKWKPVSKTTIDFLYIPEGNHYNLYVTMNEGPSRRQIQIANVRKEDTGKILLVKRSGYALEKLSIDRGIPCSERDAFQRERCLVRYDGKEARFSVDPRSYIKDRFIVPSVPKSLFSIPITNENKELARKIVETRFENNRFVPSRIRLDKEFPNKYSVAMDNWEDIIFPIDHRELILRVFSPEMYSYKRAVRSMKYEIFKVIPNKSVVLDIGTGFGGDLNRYEEMKVSKIIAIEPSKDNYDELMRRYGTGKSIGTYSFELKGYNTTMEEYDEKEEYDVIVAMLSMNFFFKTRQPSLTASEVGKQQSSLESLFSLIASSKLFIGAFMDSDYLQRLMNNGNNKYYYVVPSKVEKGSSVSIRIGDTIVEEQTEYAMNFSEFISEWEKFSKKNKITGFKIYQVKFDEGMLQEEKVVLPNVLRDLYSSYVCVILSRIPIQDFPEFKSYPENRNIKKMFEYRSSDVAKYNHQTDSMLDENSPKRMFRLDWYDEKKNGDRVFRHATLGYNDCFFHSVLTDIDEDYRLNDEEDRLKKVFEVRTKELEEYLTFDVWEKTNVYVQLLECVKERLKEDVKEEEYSENTILNELYKAYLKRITHACDIVKGGRKYGIQVDEYMIEILSNFFDRNIYFITTKSPSTKRIPYIPSNPDVQYKKGRKSIVIAFNQFGNSGHYESVGVLRGGEEIYDFESNDQFIAEIKRYIDYNKSGILSVLLFSMKEYEIKRSLDDPLPIPQENKEITILKDDLDIAKEQYIGIDKRELLALDIYADLKIEIFEKYGAEHPITNSWIKLWEIIIKFNLLPNMSNTVFCNAELPGNFVYAIICYCKTRGKKLNWYASSLYPEEGGRHSLTDKYKMFERFPERWLMNTEHKGNVLVKEDLEYIERKIDSLTNGKGVDLYTSDIGIEKKDEDEYINEEKDYFPFHIGQIICGLTTLKNKGNMVVKQFGFTMPKTIVLIGKLANTFDTCVIYKPTTSKPCNSETYIVCKGFHKTEAEELIRQLRENRLDTSLSRIQYDSIVDASMKLMNRQRTIINGTFPTLVPNTPESVSFSIFKEILRNIWMRVFFEGVEGFGKIQ